MSLKPLSNITNCSRGLSTVLLPPSFSEPICLFLIQVISAKIPANDGITVSFPIRPTKLGMVDLNVRADGGVAGDALSQPLLVKVQSRYTYRVLEEGGAGLNGVVRHTGKQSMSDMQKTLKKKHGNTDERLVFCQRLITPPSSYHSRFYLYLWA